MSDQLFDPGELEPEPKPWQQAVGWDLEAGKHLRDEGMSRVLIHTPSEYRRAFALMVQDFRTLRRRFTSEDITARIGFPPATHPNAIGALTRSIAMRYGARKLGRTKAQRKNQHATEIAVWGWE